MQIGDKQFKGHETVFLYLCRALSQVSELALYEVSYLASTGQKPSKALEQTLKDAQLDQLTTVLNSCATVEQPDGKGKDKKDAKKPFPNVPSTTTADTVTSVTSVKLNVPEEQSNSMKAIHKYVQRSVIK